MSWKYENEMERQRWLALAGFETPTSVAEAEIEVFILEQRMKKLLEGRRSTLYRFVKPRMSPVTFEPFGKKWDVPENRQQRSLPAIPCRVVSIPEDDELPLPPTPPPWIPQNDELDFPPPPPPLTLEETDYRNENDYAEIEIVPNSQHQYASTENNFYGFGNNLNAPREMPKNNSYKWIKTCARALLFSLAVTAIGTITVYTIFL